MSAHKPARPCQSAGCDEPVRDVGMVCDRCIRGLERSLGDVAALTCGRHLAAELLTTHARLARLTDSPGRGGTPDWTDADRAYPQTAAYHPLPFDPAATEALWVLGNTLSTWARVLIDDGAGSCPATGSQPIVAAWLMGRLEQVRTHPAAAEFVDEITAVVRATERTVDRPAERWYAGPCGSAVDGDTCPTELYAAPNAERITCRDCGAEHDVTARREFLLSEAENSLAHTELIAQAVTALGQPLRGDRLRQWVHRGRLVPRGVDVMGRPTYRVGDVLDLLAEDARAEARKAERHAAGQRCA